MLRIAIASAKQPAKDVEEEFVSYKKGNAPLPAILSIHWLLVLGRSLLPTSDNAS